MHPQSKPITVAIRAPFGPTDGTHVAYNLPASFVEARATTVWHVIREWGRRWRSRRELRSLSQREIADFCPKLTDALNEAEKPFWRE
jgi:uncharacterized protein YjiS (DUF1127 family)